MKKCLVVLLNLALGLTSSCSVQDDYVRADRATHDLIAPAHADYVKADPDLTSEQKVRRLVLLDSWRIRLENAEK